MTTPHIHAAAKKMLRSFTALSLLFFLENLSPLHAGHMAHAAAPSVSNAASKSESSSDTSQQQQQQQRLDTVLRADLHQEVNALLAENTRINQEKKSLLESDAQKVFWTQCLVSLMALFMVISLFSFWRLHVKAAFNNSLAELTTGLRQFQDSILSLIDTRQLAHHSVVSSFHSSVMEQETETLQAATTTKTHLNPNTEQEMSQVKNFVDAWLNVYTPGNSAHDRYLESTKNRPTSPMPWLSMIKGFRQENDQSNFESIRKEIKKLFNINVPSWNDHNDSGQKQIADYPHVLNKILELWHDDNVASYLERLLANSRINGRQGFDITLYENLENLMKLAQEPNRPRNLEQLRQIPLAAFLFLPKKPAPETNNKLSSTTPAIAKTKTAAETKTEVQPEADSVISSVSNSVVSSVSTQVESSTIVHSDKKSEPAFQTSQAAPTIPPSPTISAQDDKPALPAYEVRLKLALAYIDMGDSEGACLLLEDVIIDAPEEQRGYARELLKSLEEKIAAH